MIATTLLGNIPTMKNWRERLERRMGEAGFSMKSLSAESGLGETYVRDLLKRDREPLLPHLRAIAGVLNVSVGWLLGETDDAAEPLPKGNGFVTIPEYDVRASAGGGFFIDDETRKANWPFARHYIEELNLTPTGLVVIEVQGDSMEPTLRSGDRVMIDTKDRNPAQPGIFCLWDSDRTVVKRLEKIPASDPVTLRLKSDNTLHDAYEVLAELVNIVGRVVWFARRM